MMNLEIRLMQTFDVDTLKLLYRKNHWDMYLKDMEGFKRMFENSTAVYGAFEYDRLVGLTRVMSDNVHILYIQDVLVDPDYTKKGVGSALVKTVLEAFEHVRQKVLLTDVDAQGAHRLYELHGFKKTDQKGLVCYVRFD
jgi:ribosomal protein S18 acetylase RimI-like enzyme